MSIATKFIISWLTMGFLSSCVFYPKTTLQVIASVLLSAFFLICILALVGILGTTTEYWWGKIWGVK